MEEFGLATNFRISGIWTKLQMANVKDFHLTHHFHPYPGG